MVLDQFFVSDFLMSDKSFKSFLPIMAQVLGLTHVAEVRVGDGVARVKCKTCVAAWELERPNVGALFANKIMSMVSDVIKSGFGALKAFTGL